MIFAPTFYYNALQKWLQRAAAAALPSHIQERRGGERGFPEGTQRYFGTVFSIHFATVPSGDV
jgi:hypothetical protein